MKGNFNKGRQAVASGKAKKDLAEVHLVAYDSVRNEEHKCEPIRVRIDVQFRAALADVGGLCSGRAGPALLGNPPIYDSLKERSQKSRGR